MLHTERKNSIPWNSRSETTVTTNSVELFTTQFAFMVSLLMQFFNWFTK